LFEREEKWRLQPMSIATPNPPSFHLSPIRAEVDLDALRHNVRVLRGYAGDAEVMAAVKADAYGHGAVPVVRVLQAEGIRHFAVATVHEGIELREAGIEHPIYVLGASLPDALPAYVRHRLVATISSVEVADAVIATASRTGPLTVHIKVDTGMRRLGLLPEEVPDTLARLRDAPGVFVEGIWTHFATVDRTFTLEQLGRFDALIESLENPPPVTHVANSGTLLHLPETSRGRTLVRVGGALFGLVVDRLTEFEEAGIRPAMRLLSRVVHIRAVQPDDTVSYGRTWTATRATRIATVAAGYGDGLPRSLSNRGSVGIRGAMYPIVGRVCMDMLMADIGPESTSAAISIGDEVVLFGPGGLSAMELADAAGTIAYELTCGLTMRVPRLYTRVETVG
jgi:alanine racemase